MKKVISLALVLVVVMCAFASCGTPVEEKLAGKWTYNETILGIVTERTYVFNADGTGTAPGELVGDLLPLDMKWAVNDKTLTIEKTYSGEAVAYTFALKGDVLTLTKTDGTVITLNRAVAAK